MMPGSDTNGAESMQVDFVWDDQNDNNAETAAGGGGGPGIGIGNIGIGGGGGGNGIADDFIVENPSMDLEAYINSYTGTAKLLRLIHIADHCPAFRIESLKMAIVHIQKTMNVPMYQTLHKKLHEFVSRPLPDIAAGGGGGGAGGAAHNYPNNNELPQVDTQWIEQTSKKSQIMLEKLDADLKNYKSNSIKESIRRGYDDLGEYYLECGDLMNALKSFTRSRDYCTSAKHVITMCLNVIKVSIYLHNWSHVANFVAKAENTPDPSEEKKGNSSKEASLTSSKLRCAAGLAELANRKYKSAAKYFLQVSCDHCDFSDIVSPNNVAVYAGLCALATFERDELQEKVMSSSSFKMFLELEPAVRDVLVSFYESKYGKCLSLLDEMRENLLLDIYMAPHVQSLYCQIRNRGIIQYFRPYASADMTRMAQSFNTSTSLLENELMNLILDGQIQARIDSHNKILIARNLDERYSIFEKALKMGQDYERKTKFMIVRAAILRAQVAVKGPAKDGSGLNVAGTNSNFRSHRDRSNS